MMHTALKDRPLAFMDTETTGLIPGVHEVLEIAIVKECPLTGERESFYTLVRPKHIENAEPKALAVNGYDKNPARWEDAPTIEEVAPGLLKFLEGTVIVGHNITYDVSMINGVLLAAGISEKIPHSKLDTVTMCFEHLVPLGLESLRMDSVRDFLGWSKDGAHRAMKDVEDLERLYKLLYRMTWFTALVVLLRRSLRGSR